MSDYTTWGEETKVPCQSHGCRNAVDITKGTVFCDGCVTAKIAENELWDKAVKEEPAAERMDRLKKRIEDTASDPEKFYLSLNDTNRLAYDEMVLKEIRNTHARQAARDALRPPQGLADTSGFGAKGRPERRPPTVMPYRSDNPFTGDEEFEEVGLFYPGTINTIFGDAEVGKSLLNYAVHAWFVNQGKHTLHMDFDNNTAEEAFWRVVDSGAEVEDVEKFFHVIEMPTSVPQCDFEVSYVSLDSVNAAVAFMGGELNSSGAGIDQMYQTYLNPFVLQGACALSLDHVGHGDKDRASNNIRKIQSISGISYCMKVWGEGGKIGEKWGSTLTPNKDRPGSGPAKGSVAAYIEFDGTVGNGLCEVSVLHRVPEGTGAVIDDEALGDHEKRIYRVVADVGDGALSLNEIMKEYTLEGGTLTAKSVGRILKSLRESGKINGEKTGTSAKSPWKYWPADDGVSMESNKLSMDTTLGHDLMDTDGHVLPS